MAFKPGGDVEAGNNGGLYPNMMENPQLRWGLIRKVYMILTMQLILTTAISAVFFFLQPIPASALQGGLGIIIMISVFIFSIALLFTLYKFQNKHPLNLILLLIFTAAMSVSVGISCQFRSGPVVLQAFILTCGVTIGLTLYTFWAAKRGHDFNFLGPFLFAATMVLLVVLLLRMFFPMGKVGQLVIGCVGALIFSGYIIYDTDNLIKRFSYDEYIPAAVALYLDIINLFLFILDIMNATD